jgi:hypothetical protein
MEKKMEKLMLLNVGGNSKAIALPDMYKSYEQHLLDIDPAVLPDVLCDARELKGMPSCSYDIVYCSHNLEHYYKHDVSKVLAGFIHVLKFGGAVHIIVPNMQKVFKTMIENDLDIDDVLYESSLGPILISDVIYGYSKQIEESGVDFFAHKYGFTAKSLNSALVSEGFSDVKIGFDGFNLIALAFKGFNNQKVYNWI